MAEHTPAPWKIAYNDGSGPEYITGNNGEDAIVTLRWGCSCCKSTIDSFEELNNEEKANAHLIAAAPELLEALEIVTQDLHEAIYTTAARTWATEEVAYKHANALTEKYRVLIAKAKGILTHDPKK